MIWHDNATGFCWGNPKIPLYVCSCSRRAKAILYCIIVCSMYILLLLWRDRDLPRHDVNLPFNHHIFIPLYVIILLYSKLPVIPGCLPPLHQTGSGCGDIRSRPFLSRCHLIYLWGWIKQCLPKGRPCSGGIKHCPCVGSKSQAVSFEGAINTIFIADSLVETASTGFAIALFLLISPVSLEILLSRRRQPLLDLRSKLCYYYMAIWRVLIRIICHRRTTVAELRYYSVSTKGLWRTWNSREAENAGCEPIFLSHTYIWYSPES